LSWTRIDRGFDVIEKQYPDSLEARNERAHLAVLTGDRQMAQKYFDQMAGKVDMTVWGSPQTFLRQLAWAHQR